MLMSVDWIWKQAALFIFVSLILAKLTATDKIDASHFPTVYMPDSFDHAHVQGFSQGFILSQRGARYSSNLDCTLTLDVRGPFGIQLAFEHIDLARDSYTPDGPCEDYVQFYGGLAKETILSGQYCGTGQPPERLLANSSSVTLRFRTNHYRERSGFRIRFDRVLKDLLTDCDDRGVCDSILDEFAGGEVGVRKRSNAQGAATNSGVSVRGSSGVRWSAEVLMAGALNFWLSYHLTWVRSWYGLQNR